MMKDRDDKINEEIPRAWYGRVWCTGASVSVELGYVDVFINPGSPLNPILVGF